MSKDRAEEGKEKKGEKKRRRKKGRKGKKKKKCWKKTYFKLSCLLQPTSVRHVFFLHLLDAPLAITNT
jgi:hypothetical protein